MVNAKGAERAVKTERVQTLGFPYSVSAEFLKRNQGQTPEESLEELEKIGTLAYKAGMDVVAYIPRRLGILMARPGISMRWLRRVICWRIAV